MSLNKPVFWRETAYTATEVVLYDCMIGTAPFSALIWLSRLERGQIQYWMCGRALPPRGFRIYGRELGASGGRPTAGT